MSCEEIRELLQDYVDDELSGEQKQGVGEHLGRCLECRRELISLREMLVYFVEHRLNVIVRRSRHELEKRQARLHIVQGLLKALDVIDQVIATIRRSRTSETAERNLIKTFKFSQLQAQAILAMQLRRLAALERLFAAFVSLPFDDAAAWHYADIRHELEIAGRVIGPNDLKIAAICRANGLTLVTSNTAEFTRVSNLQVEDWLEPS